MSVSGWRPKAFSWLGRIGFDLKDVFVGAAITSILILAMWGENFWFSIFALDDFALIQVSRRLPIYEQLLLPHGQHYVGLLRLQTWVMDSLFENTSGFYATANFILLLLLCLSFYWMLMLLEREKLTYYVFLALFLTWYRLGELFSSSYILSVYLQIILFLNGTFICALLHRSRPSRFLLFSIAVLLICGTSIHLPGIVIFPSFLVLISGTSGFSVKRILNEFRFPIVVTGISGIVMLVILFMVYFVVHPGVYGANTPMDLQRGGFFADFAFNLIHGNLFAVFRSGFIVPVRNHIYNGPFSYAIGGLAIMFLFLHFRNKPNRWVALSFALVVLFSVALTTLGRGQTFQAKHHALSYAYLCLLAAVFLVDLLESLPRKIRRYAMASFIAFVAFVWVGNRFFFGNPDLEIAKNRRAAYAEIERDLLVSLRDKGVYTLVNVPGEQVFARYGWTTANYSLSDLLPLYEDALEWKVLESVSDLRDTDAETYLGLLVENSVFRNYYESTPERSLYYRP